MDFVASKDAERLVRDEERQEKDARFLKLKESFAHNLAFNVKDWIEDSNDMIRDLSGSVCESDEADEVMLRKLLSHVAKGLECFCDSAPVDLVKKIASSCPSNVPIALGRFIRLSGFDGKDSFLGASSSSKDTLPLSFELFCELNVKQKGEFSDVSIKLFVEKDFCVNPKSKDMKWFSSLPDMEGCTMEQTEAKWREYLADLKARAMKRGRIYKKSIFVRCNRMLLEARFLNVNQTWKNYNETWDKILGLSPDAVTDTLLYDCSFKDHPEEDFQGSSKKKRRKLLVPEST